MLFSDFLAPMKRSLEMAQNNTQDQAILTKRRTAMRILFYGFDDAGLDTIISDGQTNGFADGIAYSTSTSDM